MSEIKISKEVNEIKESIKNLNLGQVSELIDELKAEYNIQETAVVQTTAGAQTSEKAEEKSSTVSLKLLEIKEGANKIQLYGIIRDAVKELKGEEINIIQAKKIAEKEDKIILENAPREKAEHFKKQLEEKGAKVEIK